MSQSGLPHDAVVYPCSDGQPMAETGLHRRCMVDVADTLELWFRRHGRDDVYVGSNNFLYYERGNPQAVVAPDVYVVVGAPAGLRDTYLLWNEPKGPDFVLEVTSASTRHNDERRKRDVYAALGVREYFLYDPRAEWLAPPLQGWSKWGHDFRPDYRYVGRFIREKAGDEPIPPVLCLTAATAKPDVVVDVTSHFRDELGIELTVFDGGVQRTNLEFVVVPTTGGGAEVPVAHFIEWLVEWGRDARRRQRGLLLSTAHRAYSGSLPPGAMTQPAVGSIDRDPGRWDAYVAPFSLVAGHRR